MKPETSLLSADHTEAINIPIRVSVQQSWTQKLRRWPIVPVFIMLLLLASAIFAPLVAPHSPTSADIRARNTPPAWISGGSTQHLLGADQQGRDVLSRVIYGARISMTVAAIAISTSLLIGTSLGLLSGYFGGLIDDIIMRLVDINLAMPLILVALVLVIVFGQSFLLLIVILGLFAWSGYARQVRAETLQLRDKEYVLAARISGASAGRILWKHLLPGVIPTITVLASLQVGSLILTEAILSFLGAGVPPPTPSWGSMVADGRNYLATAWWIAIFPGVAIFLTVLAFNFMGDWLRDFMDPKLKQL